MTQCLDIHTHKPAPQPEGVISVGMDDFSPIEDQLYSVGIHPWLTKKTVTKDEWERFQVMAESESVCAIGECGIDKLKGGLLFKQLIVMNRQIEISEQLKKPLIIHDVKAHDVIVGLKRDLMPKQNWVVHGFRGKPTVAKMLTDAGIYLSFGEKFNPLSLPIVPINMMLAETDESSLSIEDIIHNLSVSMDRDMSEIIAANTMEFLQSNS